METASKSKVEVTFEWCGHKRLFQFPYPEKGEELYCPDCHVNRKVASAPSRFNSECSKCKYGKNGMLSREKVIDNARRHVEGAAHRKTHKVIIRDGTVPVFFVAYMDEYELYAGARLAEIAKQSQEVLKVGTAKPLDSQRVPEEGSPHDEHDGD